MFHFSGFPGSHAKIVKIKLIKMSLLNSQAPDLLCAAVGHVFRCSKRRFGCHSKTVKNTPLEIFFENEIVLSHHKNARQIGRLRVKFKKNLHELCCIQLTRVLLCSLKCQNRDSVPVQDGFRSVGNRKEQK